MATVEEIVVKFTGDASGMATATDRARHKVRELEERILRMGQILERAKPGSRAFEANSNALTALVKKYGEASNKLDREVAKIEKLEMRGKKALYASIPNTSAAPASGGGVRSGAAMGASFGIVNQVINALSPFFQEVGMSAASSLEQSLTGRGTSLTQATRMQEFEDDRGDYLAGLRRRRISDDERSAGRAGAGMSTTRQIEIQRTLHKRLEDQMKASTETQKSYQKTIDANESIWSASKNAAFKEAQKNLKEEIKNYRDLESAAHGVAEGLKDLQQRRWQETQQAREGIADRGRSMTERALLLSNPNMDSDDIAMMRAREDVRKRIERDNPNETAANREKMIANELEQLEAQYRRLKEAKKDAFEMDFVRGQEQKIRAFGKTAGEAFLLQQRALDKEVAPDRAAKILGDENQLRAMELKRQLEDPFERGQRELQELEAIRGNMDSETYYSAVARIQKGMQGPGPAASRAAAGFGSAEHTARILQYQRVLDQPQALANNIERVNRDKPPEGKAQDEANTYLRQIRDSLKKPTVELRPANFGGG